MDESTIPYMYVLKIIKTEKIEADLYTRGHHVTQRYIAADNKHIHILFF